MSRRPVRRAAAVAFTLAVLAGMPSQASGFTADDLLDGGQLHDIWIHINSRDWQQLRATFTENTYYPCDFEAGGVRVYNAGCRSRGASSRSGTKPGLKVEFDHYVAGQAFLGLSSLVLDNLWQDPAMIRERLSMLLFQRRGVPAPRESHARVYVGSRRDFAGVYGVIEDVDERFLQRNVGGRDGYLYEYRWLDEYRMEDLGDDLAAYAARFAPRTRTSESTFALFAPIRELIRVINDTPAPDLEPALAPYLDLHAFIAEVAVENFLSDWDGVLGDLGLGNFYLYRPASVAPAILIPWDKDNALSRVEMSPSHNVDENVLMRKVWAVPELRREYLQTLLDVARTSGWMEEEARREYDQIHDAAMQDPLKPTSNEEFEREVTGVLQLLRDRPGVLMRAIELIAPGLNGTARIQSQRIPPRE